MLYDRRDFGLLRLAGAYQWLPLVPLRALSPLKQLFHETELALLDIAIQGKRRFAMIHFSSTGRFQTDLFLPGEFDREDVLKAAETFLDGNTDYKTPLQEALRLMEEAGFENADMVFVTDGACTLPGDFLDHLKEEQARRGFSITGVLLDRDAAGFSFSLVPFCTVILRTSELTQEKIAENLLNARAA